MTGDLAVTLHDLITRYMVSVTASERLAVPIEEYLRRRGWRLEELTPASGGVAWVTAWAPDGGPLVTTSTTFAGLL